MPRRLLVLLSLMACCHGIGAIDHCRSSPCLHGGACLNGDSVFECKCQPGFTGKTCNYTLEIDCSPGKENPCQNGGVCESNNGSSTCRCSDGYGGRNCEDEIDTCQSGRIKCENGGVCHQETKCKCKTGFSGEMCQTNDCEPNPCVNGGVCQHTTGGPTCKCLPGSKGQNCEVESYNNCINDPCLHGGSCKDEIDRFECTCPKNWNGVQCEVKDGDFRGGRGVPAVPKMDGTPGICSQHNCSLKGDNGICDTECNFPECNYDNKECSYGTIPWSNCQEQTIQCSKVFKNGVCNPLCNTQECLFDGFDCQNTAISGCNNTRYCNVHYGDGQCDELCNTAACNWDGLDCDKNETQIIPGTLFIVVLIGPNEFQRMETKFLRALGQLLRATVTIDGERGILPWEGEGEDKTSGSVAVFNNSTDKNVTRTKVYLQVHNHNCQDDASSECFNNINLVGEYIAASLQNGDIRLPLALSLIGTESPDTTEEDRQDRTTTIVVMAAGGLLFFTAVVVVITQRKRIRSNIWFPEGFLTNQWSKKAHGESVMVSDGTNTELSVTNSSAARPPEDTNGMASHSFQNSYRQASHEGGMPQTKKAKLECQVSYTNHHTSGETDLRQWSATHLDAPNVPHASILSQTPPDGDGNLCDFNDINVKGPGGYTPLMVACIRRGGLGEDDYGNSDSVCREDATDIGSGTQAEAISDLLMRGAAVDVQTELTGETALHLASRYAKADAVKVLLDAGANPNAQDGTGRTPLHAAVAAGAGSVFQILLRNRSTNLNARTHMGATPLILASSLSIENTVEELISADADMEAVDRNGRTALHWAAAVNNVSAVFTLLKNNANIYVQDDKGQTPLFLASKEGAFETVKLLLDNCAKRNIVDHMDRLPRDIASERMHHDIVSLLDSYNATSSSSGISPSGNATWTPPTRESAGNVKNPRKSRSRKSKNTQIQDKDCLAAQSARTSNGGAKPKNKKKSDGNTALRVNQTGNQLQCIQTSLSSLQSSQHQQSLGVLSPTTTISPTSASADSNHSSPGYNGYSHNDSLLLPGSSTNGMEASSVNVQRPIACDDYQSMVKEHASPSTTNQVTFPNIVPEWDISQRQPQHQDHHHQNQRQLGQQQHVSYIKSPAGDGQNNFSSPHGFHGMCEKENLQQVMGGVNHSLHPSSTACAKGNHPLNMSPTDNDLQVPQHTHHIVAFGSPTNGEELLQPFYLDSPPSQHIASPVSSNFNMIENQRFQHEQLLPTAQSLQYEQQGCTVTIGQHLTPPSQTNELIGQPVSQAFNNNINNKYNENGYLLPIPSHHLSPPSPDSSANWSSSPHSALSDWSDGISSPIPSMPQRSK